MIARIKMTPPGRPEVINKKSYKSDKTATLIHINGDEC